MEAAQALLCLQRPPRRVEGRVANCPTLGREARPWLGLQGDCVGAFFLCAGHG